MKFHLFYSVEGTLTPDILKIFWLGLGPFNPAYQQQEY